MDCQYVSSYAGSFRSLLISFQIPDRYSGYLIDRAVPISEEFLDGYPVLFEDLNISFPHRWVRHELCSVRCGGQMKLVTIDSNASGSDSYPGGERRPYSFWMIRQIIVEFGNWMPILT